MNIRILNIKQVREKTSLSAPTIWRRERKGEFPIRRQISTNRVGWVEEEVENWLASRIAGIGPTKIAGAK